MKNKVLISCLIFIFTFSMIPTGYAARRISPRMNNPIVTSEGVRFSWSYAAAVDEYKLQVYSRKPRLVKTYRVGQKTAETISDLPQDGRRMYARIVAYKDRRGVWSATKRFTAKASGAAARVGKASSATAAITSPKDGATFSSTEATFRWTTGGKTAELAYLYFFKGQKRRRGTYYRYFKRVNVSGNKTSATVTGLPNDGSSIKVRLSLYEDRSNRRSTIPTEKNYYYTAHKGSNSALSAKGAKNRSSTSVVSKPEITSPKNGAKLEEVQKFTWNAYPEATKYYLYLKWKEGGRSKYRSETIKSGSTSITLEEAGRAYPKNSETVTAYMYAVVGRKLIKSESKTYTAYKSSGSDGILVPGLDCKPSSCGVKVNESYGDVSFNNVNLFSGKVELPINIFNISGIDFDLALDLLYSEDNPKVLSELGKGWIINRPFIIEKTPNKYVLAMGGEYIPLEYYSGSSYRMFNDPDTDLRLDNETWTILFKTGANAGTKYTLDQDQRTLIGGKRRWDLTEKSFDGHRMQYNYNLKETYSLKAANGQAFQATIPYIKEVIDTTSNKKIGFFYKNVIDEQGKNIKVLDYVKVYGSDGRVFEKYAFDYKNAVLSRVKRVDINNSSNVKTWFGFDSANGKLQENTNKWGGTITYSYNSDQKVSNVKRSNIIKSNPYSITYSAKSGKRVATVSLAGKGRTEYQFYNDTQKKGLLYTEETFNQTGTSVLKGKYEYALTKPYSNRGIYYQNLSNKYVSKGSKTTRNEYKNYKKNMPQLIQKYGFVNTQNRNIDPRDDVFIDIAYYDGNLLTKHVKERKGSASGAIIGWSEYKYKQNTLPELDKYCLEESNGRCSKWSTIGYVHDGFHRLVSQEIKQPGSQSRAVVYEYDINTDILSNKTTYKNINGNLEVSSQYNQDNSLASTNYPYDIAYTYDAFGRESTKTEGPSHKTYAWGGNFSTSLKITDKVDNSTNKYTFLFLDGFSELIQSSVYYDDDNGARLYLEDKVIDPVGNTLRTRKGFVDVNSNYLSNPKRILNPSFTEAPIETVWELEPNMLDFVKVHAARHEPYVIRRPDFDITEYVYDTYTKREKKDAFGSLKEVRLINNEDPSVQEIVSYDTDYANTSMTVENGNEKIEIEYDLFWRKKRSKESYDDELISHKGYEYDGDGNIISTFRLNNDDGQISGRIDYVYDGALRLVGYDEEETAGVDLLREYDNVRIKGDYLNGIMEHKYVYDNNGMLKEYDGQAYTYNGLQEVVKVENTKTGVVTKFEYDPVFGAKHIRREWTMEGVSRPELVLESKYKFSTYGLDEFEYTNNEKRQIFHDYSYAGTKLNGVESIDVRAGVKTKMGFYANGKLKSFGEALTTVYDERDERFNSDTIVMAEIEYDWLGRVKSKVGPHQNDIFNIDEYENLSKPSIVNGRPVVRKGKAITYTLDPPEGTCHSGCEKKRLNLGESRGTMHLDEGTGLLKSFSFDVYDTQSSIDVSPSLEEFPVPSTPPESTELFDPCNPLGDLKESDFSKETISAPPMLPRVGAPQYPLKWGFISYPELRGGPGYFWPPMSPYVGGDPGAPNDSDDLEYPEDPDDPDDPFDDPGFEPVEGDNPPEVPEEMDPEEEEEEDQEVAASSAEPIYGDGNELPYCKDYCNKHLIKQSPEGLDLEKRQAGYGGADAVNIVDAFMAIQCGGQPGEERWGGPQEGCNDTKVYFLACCLKLNITRGDYNEVVHHPYMGSSNRICLENCDEGCPETNEETGEGGNCILAPEVFSGPREVNGACEVPMCRVKLDLDKVYAFDPPNDLDRGWWEPDWWYNRRKEAFAYYLEQGGLMGWLGDKLVARGTPLQLTAGVLFDAIAEGYLLKGALKLIRSSKYGRNLMKGAFKKWLNKASRFKPARSACSFLEGTKIMTPAGEYNIEDIRSGDIIMSYNEAKSEADEQFVQKTFVGRDDQYIEITYADGQVLKATLEHPFYVGKQYVPAKNLKEGDTIYVLKEDNLEPVKVVKVETKQGDFAVYNMEVNSDHNYFANGALVHNGGGYCRRVVGEKTLGGVQTYETTNTGFVARGSSHGSKIPPSTPIKPIPKTKYLNPNNPADRIELMRILGMT